METTYGIAVKGGKFQAQRVMYEGKRTVIEALSEFTTVADAVKALPTAELVKMIEKQQTAQKRAASTQAIGWKVASEMLAVLFPEMARRQAANGGELDWQKWQ